MLANNVLELINNTPMVKLDKIKEKYNLCANLYGKLEKNNPTGSIKDRTALQMIEDAEKMNIINKDTVIIEPTSGNTGVGLAAICAYKNYKLIICMPESMSDERKRMMKIYGANLILTPSKFGMKGSIQKALEISKEYPNHFIPSQFDNSSNPKVHYNHTGFEIYKDLNSKVDAIVAGIGTGGTISGCTKYLKEKNSKFKAFGVEPFESPVISKNEVGPHKIQGIGAGFIPKNLERELVDEIITVKSDEAIEFVKEVACLEGLFVGISSCAAIVAAIEVAKRKEFENKNIVVILPDTGERYLSMLEGV